MSARQSAIAAIAGHRVASPQKYLEHAGEAIYGQYVFHEDAQREYLAKPIFRKLRQTIDGHEPFDPGIVDAVAHGVKEWALAHGAMRLGRGLDLPALPELVEHALAAQLESDPAATPSPSLLDDALARVVARL